MPKALDDLLCRKSGSAVVTKRWHTKWPTAQRTKNRSKNARIDAEFLREAPVNESKVVELKRKKGKFGSGRETQGLQNERPARIPNGTTALAD